MEQVDLKDRKILYELDLNCRQSNAQIGKKVGLSKEVVTYPGITVQPKMNPSKDGGINKINVLLFSSRY